MLNLFRVGKDEYLVVSPICERGVFYGTQNAVVMELQRLGMTKCELELGLFEIQSGHERAHYGINLRFIFADSPTREENTNEIAS